MITYFLTRSGASYEVNDEQRTWTRVRGPLSAVLRTEDGRFYDRSEITVGQPVLFFCPPIAIMGGGMRSQHRLIMTTPVERVWHA